MAGRIELYIGVFLSFYENCVFVLGVIFVVKQQDYIFQLNLMTTNVDIDSKSYFMPTNIRKAFIPKMSALDHIYSTVVENVPLTQIGNCLAVLVFFSLKKTI